MEREKTPYSFSGKGEVYSYTLFYKSTADSNINTPHHLAIIELETDDETVVRVTSQLTDLDYTWEDYTDKQGVERKRKKYDVRIGMPVEMVTRRMGSTTDERGMLVYGYKFRPPVVS